MPLRKARVFWVDIPGHSIAYEREGSHRRGIFTLVIAVETGMNLEKTTLAELGKATPCRSRQRKSNGTCVVNQIRTRCTQPVPRWKKGLWPVVASVCCVPIQPLRLKAQWVKTALTKTLCEDRTSRRRRATAHHRSQCWRRATA